MCVTVSPLRRYDEITSKGPVKSDPDQRKVIEKLDNLWYKLREYKPKAYKEQGKSRSVSEKYLVFGHFRQLNAYIIVGKMVWV